MDGHINMNKSGFEINPIGYTGFFCGAPIQGSNGCFHNCIIISANNQKFEVETDYGLKFWINKKEFTPIYRRVEYADYEKT